MDKNCNVLVKKAKISKLGQRALKPTLKGECKTRWNSKKEKVESVHLNYDVLSKYPESAETMKEMDKEVTDC